MDDVAATLDPALLDAAPPEPAPSPAARLRAIVASPGFREDLRFFLTAYVIAFVAFMTWVA